MIARHEILQGREVLDPLTPEMEQNLEALLKACNILRAEYGRPMVVSSGYRPRSINSAVGGRVGSPHLRCQAVDFLDRAGLLAAWCLAHMDVLEAAGLYMEDPKWTPTWVHLQINPPASGRRVFIP